MGLTRTPGLYLSEVSHVLPVPREGRVPPGVAGEARAPAQGPGKDDRRVHGAGCPA